SLRLSILHSLVSPLSLHDALPICCITNLSKSMTDPLNWKPFTRNTVTSTPDSLKSLRNLSCKLSFAMILSLLFMQKLIYIFHDYTLLYFVQIIPFNRKLVPKKCQLALGILPRVLPDHFFDTFQIGSALEIRQEFLVSDGGGSCF